MKTMERFNILNNMKYRESKEGKFVKQIDFLEMEKSLGLNQTGLIIAPAGSGKTTTVRDLSAIDFKNGVKTKRIFLVPTTVIRDQSSIDEEFIYTVDGDFSKEKFDKANLIISVYDSVIKFQDFINPEDIIYVDEAHEFIGYRAMNDNKKFALQITDLMPNRRIFLTATPYNLHDSFAQKIYYTASLNKSVNIITNNQGRTTGSLLNIIRNSKRGSKHLIYINSVGKIDKLMDILSKEFPGLRIEKMTSSDKTKNKELYAEILDNNVTSDILLSTKFLNVGVDFQGQFDYLHYFDKSDANSLFQFINRERKESNLYVYKNGREEDYKLWRNVNTLSPIVMQQNEDLNTQETILLNRFTYVNGDLDLNMFTNDTYVRQILRIEDIENILNIFYVNSNMNVLKIDDIDEKGYNLANTSTTIKKRLKTLEENGVTVASLGTAYMKGTLNDVLGYYDAYSASLSNKLTLIFDNYAPQLIEDFKLSDILFVTDNSNRDKITNEKLCSIINDIEIALNNGLTPDIRDEFIKKLNVGKFKINNKKWTSTNFKYNLERFDLYIESKVKKIDGKPVRVLSNKTIVIENTKDLI